MNDLYTRDRMERNKQDFDGSGVGSGRYDSRQEQVEKWNEIKLPLVLSIFLVIVWVGLIYISMPDFQCYISGTKVLVEPDRWREYEANWEAPDGKIYNTYIERARKVNGRVAIYYMGEDYAGARVLTPLAEWLALYAICLFCTAGLGIWIKRILYQKHRAVPKQEEHNYKDY